MDQARQGIALYPEFTDGYVVLAQTAASLGRHDIALQAAADAEKLQLTPRTRAMLMLAYSSLDRPGDVQRLLRDQIAANAADPIDPQEWMVTYLGAGDYDRALDTLLEGVSGNFPTSMSHFLHFSHKDSFFDPVRHDPRFVEAVAQTNIPFP
jgi:hypothetical protein